MEFITDLKISNDLVKISINGITHLCFRYSKYLGFQTWIDSEETRWKIEVAVGDFYIEVHYDRKDKFLLVLEQLEKVMF